MTKTAAEHQAAYRRRQAEKAGKMRHALEALLTKLAGNEKPLAVELRAIAEEALR